MRLRQNARARPNCLRVIIRQIRERGRSIADFAADFENLRRTRGSPGRHPPRFPSWARASASSRAAWHQVEEWLDCEAAWIPAPTERHRRVLGQLLAATSVRANLVPDAHLAALAIEHGLVLASTEGDFARFPGVRFENPLARSMDS